MSSKKSKKLLEKGAEKTTSIANAYFKLLLSGKILGFRFCRRYTSLLQLEERVDRDFSFALLEVSLA